VPTTTDIPAKSGNIRLLDHAAFRHMNRHQGLAVVDLKHEGEPFYRRVVSCLPFESPVYYAPTYWGKKSLVLLLGLPPGTITQRTLTYAVRCHPENPASSQGAPDRELFGACKSHAEHQARLGLQGHHNWESRFHRIWNRVGGEMPVEVCAESWPGERLVPACFSCVHAWRQSSGHWNAVRRRQPAFGYDIRRGLNRIWYATGIFGGRWR
jgi:hypothetical protein